ncbi:hypothetical protein K457DRAFT_720573 [Linnemannia elongata AG-77]|uniref:Uncharacterized protein n=1 Tax=Linnemannia elongata AG-77 TaxID=1314771 RepID=A0A197KCL5_9FUNG|nr:hypothetical protein K457DRAFT_720573 [Linnemannia elongata AG-77]
MGADDLCNSQEMNESKRDDYVQTIRIKRVGMYMRKRDKRQRRTTRVGMRKRTKEEKRRKMKEGRKEGRGERGKGRRGQCSLKTTDDH